MEVLFTWHGVGRVSSSVISFYLSATMVLLPFWLTELEPPIEHADNLMPLVVTYFIAMLLAYLTLIESRLQKRFKNFKRPFFGKARERFNQKLAQR